MAFTASVEVDRLPTASAYTTPPSSLHLHTLLIPNLDPRASVKSSIKKFIRENLAVPDDLQCISAPLFSVLGDQEVVEDIYGRFCCSAEAENSELHVDEESFTFFAREKGRHVDLTDDDRLDQRHVIDSCKLHLKVLPQRLPEQGGRIFVEMKNGILPIQGISPRTSVSQIKRKIEKITGIPSSQQLLSSVGRIMHDEFYVDDFNGLHSIYEDSTLDLCKSGDSNSEQSHRRVPVKVCVKNDVEFIVVVQGRDTVRSIMQLVEARTGCAPCLQKISFSGKILDEKKTLSDCFIYPDCALQVNIFKKAPRAGMRRISDDDLQEQSDLFMDDERKPLARKIKLVRTLKGSVTGTVTIPVLTTDRIIELRKKIKRSLQPLVERNLSMPTPQREPKHIDITPGCKFSSTNLSNMNSSSSNLKSSNCISGSPSSAENVKQNISIRNLTSALSLANNSTKKPAGTRPCLSSGSTPVNNVVQPSSLSSPSPPSAGLSSVSRIPSASASRIHIEHPSDCSPLSNKTASARRLHFEPISSNASNLVGKELDQANNRSENQATRPQEASKPENQKRSFGAWINSSVHALTDQIRAQLTENQ